MTPAEARKVATEHGWLARQDAAFRARLLDAAKLLRFAPGDLLAGLDDPPGGLWCVVEGYVAAVVAPGPFPPMLVAFGGPGWWFGEMAFITGTPRRVDLRARVEVAALMVPSRVLERIAADDALIWKRLAAISIGHFDHALAHVACLRADNGLLKVAVSLLLVAGPTAERLDAIDVPIRQDELGEIVGLSRNRIGRILAELEREAAAVAGYRRVTVRPAQLRRVIGRHERT